MKLSDDVYFKLKFVVKSLGCLALVGVMLTGMVYGLWWLMLMAIVAAAFWIVFFDETERSGA